MKHVNKVSLLCAVALCVLLVVPAFGGSNNSGCGSFDTQQLRDDLDSGHFERGGVELAKSTLRLLAKQLDCERGR